LAALQDFQRDEGFEVLRHLLGALNTDMLGPLMKSLQDQKRGVRMWAALVLDELGPEAASAASALADAAGDKEPTVRLHAIEALWRSGAGAATLTPVLSKALKDKDVLVRVKAAQFLAQLDPQNKAAVLVLIETLQERSDDPKAKKARPETALFLGGLGERAK